LEPDPDPLPPLPTPEAVARRVIRLAALGCLLFLTWAATQKLDIVSMADGEVAPSGRVKALQHLEGGILQRILAREGDVVRKDQVLVMLEKTSSDADLGELSVRLNSLQGEIARLEAESSDGDDAPQYPETLRQDHPEVVERSLQLFHARLEKRNNELQTQRELITQKRQDLREIEVRLTSNRKGLLMLKEQTAISEKLLQKELTSRYDHLSLLRESGALESRIGEDEAALLRGKAALETAEREIENKQSAWRAEARESLENARREFNELSNRLRKLEDNLHRTILRSPVDGVVKTLYFNTVGGVIKPGETVLDIVPVGDRLRVEANLPPQDVGYVQPGQYAGVKMRSQDVMRFDRIHGHVAHVSPDTVLVGERKEPFYKVYVEPESLYFQRGDWKYPLRPGMQVSVQIQIGERSVLEYVLDPFIDSLQSALREK
ncbi:MAG: HlyD family type I secretion periplasmic adaptor subunit, partial [Magnetococcales bacterium]|nr:HlyD family type I secretion periplasmic adaptor subunit [Magnetococcales bacterium]